MKKLIYFGFGLKINLRRFCSKIPKGLPSTEENYEPKKDEVLAFPKEENIDVNKILESLEKLPSIYPIYIQKRTENGVISIQELLHTREFAYATLMLFYRNFEASRETFFQLKNFLFSAYLGTPIYLLVIRRLGLALLKSGKVKEGIMEIENVDLLAKDRTFFNPNFKFNCEMDRLRLYILFDPIQV